jgi:hypothetical protein
MSLKLLCFLYTKCMKQTNNYLFNYNLKIWLSVSIITPELFISLRWNLLTYFCTASQISFILHVSHFMRSSNKTDYIYKKRHFSGNVICITFLYIYLSTLSVTQIGSLYSIHMKLHLFYSSVYNATTLFIRSYTFTICFGLNRPSSGISLFSKLLPAFTIRHTFFPIVLFHIYVTVTFWTDISQPTIHRDLIFITLD